MKFTIFTGALSWLLVIFLSPVAIPIFATFWLGRFLVYNLSKIQKFKSKDGAGIEDPVTSLDTLFTLGQFYTSPQGVNLIVLLLEGPLDLKKLQDKFASVLLNTKGYDRLHSLRPIVWWGYSFWTSASSNPAVSLKSTFQVKDHFLTETKEICGDASLDRYIAKYMRRPFSVDRPCWDTLYIQNFRQNPSSDDVKPVFILRSHHITGDGVSNSLLLHRLADTDSVSVPGIPTTDKNKAKPIAKVIPKQDSILIAKAKFQNLIAELQNVYWAPLLLVHQVKEFNFHKDFLTKKKSSQDCTLLRTEMSLEDFKTVRRQHFGDSPLGSLAVQNWIAAGTLRKLYKRELGIGAIDPKSTSSASVLSSLPWTGASIKSNVSKFHNQFTVGFFKMPLNEPCRLKRKKAIIQDCRNISKFRFPQVYRNVLPFYGLLPFLVVKAILGNNVGASGQLGTVVGPQRPIYLGGARVVNLWGITGIQYPHMGMTNLQSSYDGRMTSTFLFNKDLIPSQDTAALDKDFKDEFQSILASKN